MATEYIKESPGVIEGEMNGCGSSWRPQGK